MSKKKIHRLRKKSTAAQSSAAINPEAHPDAAGIDVGAEELVVAVPRGRGTGATVRTFSAFTRGLRALRGWLLDCGIKTVAIESTGNYWINIYDLLEEAGMEVYLVNARYVKAVPGRKTDVSDAQWLQHLHAAGLLKKSFRPLQPVVPLRYLMRHRQTLVQEASSHVQRMQKVLTEMNLKIQHVFSDVDGQSAQAIITAILAGERAAAKLAALRDWRCRTPLPKILEALEGHYREEYLFVLKLSQTAWHQTRDALAACDEQIARLAARVTGETEEPLPPAPAAERRMAKNAPDMPVYEEAWRFYGVDLGRVPGVGPGLLTALMSEIGTGGELLKAFPEAENVTSWAGLCPDNRISGGKVLKAKTRKVPSRLAAALRLAAQGVSRANNRMGDYCRKMKGRLGKAEGIVATAHKLMRIIYGMIKSQQPYDETIAFRVTPATLQRRLKHLHKQAAALGFQLTPATNAA